MGSNEETFVNGDSARSVTLTVRQGPNPGQRFTIDKDGFSIGRLPDNDVSISDQQISRHHARVAWENGQYIIRDLGSANGTTVNGAQLTGPCPLHNGDVVGFGDVMLTFEGTPGALADSAQTFVKPGSSPGPSSPTIPTRQPGTVPIPQPIRKNSSTPILIGLGAVAIVAIIAIAALLFLFVFQSQAGPKISVQQPLNGSQVQAGQPVTILASVKDPKGVSRVEFWVNNSMEATIASSILGGQEEFLVQQTWTPQSSGVYNLSLRGFNTQGEMSEPFNMSITAVGAGQEGTPASTSPSSSTATVIPTNTVPPSPACTNGSAFVADITVPDNSVFPPGARIDKTWRLRNNGTCPWQTGYQLVFVSGDKMSAPDSQAIAPTAPGGTADVTVTMYAPNNPGIYKGIWRMVTNTGQSFGQSLTVLIQVPSPNTSTPTVTSTSPPPPGPIVQLTADNTTLNAGQCTMIRASVQNVTAAWLDGEPIVGGYKEKQVCPCNDTTYNLEAVPPSGPHIFRNVTVNVNGVCPENKPDLVIKDFEADYTTVFKGVSNNYKVRIKNEGPTQASNFAVAWQPFGSGTTTWIIVGDNINLAPGEDKWVNWSYTYNDAGTYDTKAVVDQLNNVDENNEGNNSKNLNIEVIIFNPGIILTIGPIQPLPMITLTPPGGGIQLSPAILTAIASGNVIQP